MTNSYSTPFRVRIVTHSGAVREYLTARGMFGRLWPAEYASASAAKAAASRALSQYPSGTVFEVWEEHQYIGPDSYENEKRFIAARGAETKWDARYWFNHPAI